MLAFPPDVTFLVELGSFFILLFLLNRLLFRPYMELLAERADRSSGDAERARREEAEAEELRARIEAELEEARARAHEQVEAIRRATKQEEARSFELARTQAAERLAALRARIEQAREQAQSELAAETERMAGSMVEAVLEGGSR